MCAEYKVAVTFAGIERELGTAIDNLSARTEWDARVKLSLTAPVLAARGGKIKLNELVFPVNPFPNARLSRADGERVVRIYDVPTWKTSFEKYPCVVPMTSFYEPAYWGAHKGEVIEFADSARGLMFVPAILIKPRVPATGKLNAFSLLTHTASDQMLGYHHRLLVMLKPADARTYLELTDVSAEERFEFLLEHRHVPRLKTATERKLAKGWDKRVEQHREALGDEEKYRKVLQTEGVSA